MQNPTQTTNASDAGKQDRLTGRQPDVCRPPGLTIVAVGTPRPQPRPRFAAGRVISTADPNARLWIASFERACKQALEIVGGRQALPGLLGQDAVSVKMQFRFSFQKVAGRKPKRGRQSGSPHVSKPDTDNLAKLVLDCLTRQGVVKDDCLVSSLTVDKVWSDLEHAGVTVWVQPYAPAFQPSGWTERQGYPCDPSPDPPAWLREALRASEQAQKRASPEADPVRSLTGPTNPAG